MTRLGYLVLLVSTLARTRLAAAFVWLAHKVRPRDGIVRNHHGRIVGIIRAQRQR